jgi:hypothetical protein
MSRRGVHPRQPGPWLVADLADAARHTDPGDEAAGADVIRSEAERAGATITEVEGSHVIMVSQPQAVTDVILEAVGAVG